MRGIECEYKCALGTLRGGGLAFHPSPYPSARLKKTSPPVANVDPREGSFTFYPQSSSVSQPTSILVERFLLQFPAESGRCYPRPMSALSSFTFRSRPLMLKIEDAGSMRSGSAALQPPPMATKGQQYHRRNTDAIGNNMLSRDLHWASSFSWLHGRLRLHLPPLTSSSYPSLLHEAELRVVTIVAGVMRRYL
jgi:hypothetical protein